MKRLIWIIAAFFTLCQFACESLAQDFKLDPWRPINNSESIGRPAFAQERLFLRGSNNRLYWRPIENLADPAAGFAPTHKDAVTSSDPSACYLADEDRLYLFYRTEAASLAYITFANSEWSAPTDLGGHISPGSSPTVCSATPGTLSVFVEGDGSAIYYRSFIGKKWDNWLPVPSDEKPRISRSAPEVCSANGQIFLFFLNENGALYFQRHSNSHWDIAELVGGSYLLARPTLIVHKPDLIEVVARGENNQLYHLTSTGTTWGGWEPVAGGICKGQVAGVPLKEIAGKTLRFMLATVSESDITEFAEGYRKVQPPPPPPLVTNNPPQEFTTVTFQNNYGETFKIYQKVLPLSTRTLIWDREQFEYAGQINKNGTWEFRVKKDFAARILFYKTTEKLGPLATKEVPITGGQPDEIVYLN